MPQAKLQARLPDTNNGELTASLRQRVKQALLSILDDPTASAAAKASAGRTLLDYFDEHEHASGSGKRASEMTLAELDAELAQR